MKYREDEYKVDNPDYLDDGNNTDSNCSLEELERSADDTSTNSGKLLSKVAHNVLGSRHGKVDTRRKTCRVAMALAALLD